MLEHHIEVINELFDQYAAKKVGEERKRILTGILEIAPWWVGANGIAVVTKESIVKLVKDAD